MQLSFTQLTELLVGQFDAETVVVENTQALQPRLLVETQKIADVCRFLHESEQTYFDLLECVSAIDNGPETGTMEIFYHLYSIPYEHALALRIVFPRSDSAGNLPEVPTVSHIWRTADWHEREAYDLLGIRFVNHPDLRRILLPADWEGHPLRKDYTEQDRYHGITVKYDFNSEL